MSLFHTSEEQSEIWSREIWSRLSFPEAELKFLLSLYIKFQNDLRSVKNSQVNFYSIKDTVGLIPQLGDLEAEITYLRIREYKPVNVIEISPGSGWSTSWILHAIKDNGAGMLYSYDVIDDSTRTIPASLSQNRWSFSRGNVKENINLLPPHAEYLFIDSDHCAEFANWYIHNLFPLFRQGTKVSVHDILKYPYESGWGEESPVICSWLAEKKIPCMTASRALKDKGYSEILKLRVELKLDIQIHPPDYNSMIFFSL